MKKLLVTSFTVLCVAFSFSQKSSTVGQRITGDFNGDGKMDTAFAKQIINTKTKAKSWTVSFSDKTISSLRFSCCEVVLINEGDLNNDKATEISIFQAPENGCTYMWTTYTYKANHWTKLIPTFLVPTFCDPVEAADLEGKVFVEKGKVYYWDFDPNDEKFKPIKKQVILK